MSNESTFLGISLSDNNLLFAEIISLRERMEITQLASLRMDDAFDFKTIAQSKNIAEKISNSILSALRMKGISPQKVALSIPDRMGLIRLLPIDSSLEKKEISEHLLWEVDQSVLSGRDDYITDFSCLPSEVQDYTRVLLVAVRKTVINIIKQAFGPTGLSLTAIDFDIFTAIRALEENYELRDNSYNLIIQFLPTYIQAVVLQGAELIYIEDFPHPGNTETDATGRNLEMAEFVYNNISKLILRSLPNKEVSDIDRIFLFGRALPVGLLEDLQDLFSAPVDVVNPFNKIMLSSKAEESLGTHDPHDFLIAVGAALRGLS